MARRKPNLKQPLCGAKNRHGEPCANYRAKGRTRCRFHGGASTGPRTRRGLIKAAANLRTHGFYSRLLPAEPDAQLYDEAPADASVGAELKLLRAKLGTLVLAGAGDRTQMEVVDEIRRLAQVERLPGIPPAMDGPREPHTLRVIVDGVAPEKRGSVIDLTKSPPALTDGE